MRHHPPESEQRVPALADRNVLFIVGDTTVKVGGHYAGTATGSSASTPMLKFFARLGGIRVEFIIHTNHSYLNYIYQRDVAHDEYEVKRIFDTGVADFLFPFDIYSLKMDEIRTAQIKLFRKQIEES
jgi:hypothetical protein